MKKVCEHERLARRWGIGFLGAITAVVVFIALHVAVPALVAGGIVHSAHAAAEPEVSVVFKHGKVTVYLIEAAAPSGFGRKNCLVAIAEGKMATTVDMECM
jgi:hypothetical protein